uniref:Uncharacterized protein LOC111131034 n=1 Tax=Crassostrea virginica TaxID=6565 RepID=A0A8B8E2S7_CRAVI|nr:uncharacterized protein LOC111131034 [Crassostrea virginica]
MASCVSDTMECNKHPGELIQRLCANCNVYVCLECVSLSHAGHVFKKFRDIMEEKKKELEHIVKLTKEETLEDLEKKVERAKKQKELFCEEIQNKVDLVQKRAEVLKAAVDAIKDKYLQELLKTKTEHVKEFDDAEEKLRGTVGAVKSLVEGYELVLRSDNQSSVIEGSRNAEHEIEKSIPNVSIPNYRHQNWTFPEIGEEITKLFVEVVNEEYLGSDYVDEGVSSEDSDPAELKFACSTLTRNRRSPIRVKRNRSRAQNRKNCRILLSADIRTPARMKVGNDDQNVSSIFAASSREAWMNITGDSHSSEVQRVQKHGNICDRITREAEDFCIGQSDNLYATERHGSRVFEYNLKDKTFNTMANLSPYIVKGVKVMASGDLAVCTLDKSNFTVSKQSKRTIRILNSAGNFISDIEFAGNTNNKLFVHPHRVEERVDDFCVVDRLSENEGRLIVVSKSSKVRFTYTGIEKNPRHRFDPRDVVVADDSSIYIADRNYGIHQLTPLGLFARYLITYEGSLYRPLSVTIDDELTAWVGCEKGIVQRLKIQCCDVFIEDTGSYSSEA